MLVTKLPRTSLTGLERSLIEKLQRSVTFPPGGSHKRFIRELTPNSQLSDRGRMYLGYIAHRYRRQLTATAEETEWIRNHQFPQVPGPNPEPEGADQSQRIKENTDVNNANRDATARGIREGTRSLFDTVAAESL
jgi:hypothetical protein